MTWQVTVLATAGLLGFFSTFLTAMILADRAHQREHEHTEAVLARQFVEAQQDADRRFLN